MNHARDFSKSRISIRRIHDGYQKESCPEEEGRCEEEEVRAAPLRARNNRSTTLRASETRPFFDFEGSGDGALFCCYLVFRRFAISEVDPHPFRSYSGRPAAVACSTA